MSTVIRKTYNCAVCHKPAPSGKCVFVRGVPIGPICLSRLRRREYIRSAGPNSLVVLNPETNFTHTVSDYADQCPSREVHCLQCPHLGDKICPAELKYGDQFECF